MHLSAQGRGDNLSEWGTSGVIVDLKAAREMLAFSRDEKKGATGSTMIMVKDGVSLKVLFVCLFV